MTPMTDTEIEDTVSRFLACTLPKARWTHAAHFAAALWLLRAQGEAAFAAMPDLIRCYNESVGGRNTDTEGYHETITQASLHMAAMSLRDAQEGAPLGAVLARLLAGPCGRPDWIFAYWSREALFTPEARRGWIAPDLAPLPAT